MRKGIKCIGLLIVLILFSGNTALADDLQTVLQDDPSCFIKEGGLPETITDEVEQLLNRKTGVKVYARSSASGLTFEEYLVNQLEQLEERIDVESYNLSKEDIYNVYAAVLNKHPELYYVNTRVTYSYYQTTGIIKTLTVSYADYDREAVEAELNKTLKLVKEDMSDLEKIIFIHDYLCVDVEYAYQDYLDDTLGPDVHNLKGAVLDKCAVCDGYSSAFQYYMVQLGIPCNIVINNDHAWNQVCLDGAWYMVDVTFDDPIWDNYGFVRHSYLLNSQNKLLQDRTWEVEDYEICTKTTYDNAFWSDVNAQMICHDSTWFFIDSDKNLYQHDFRKDAIGEKGKWITELGGVWYQYGGTAYYTGNQIKLASGYGLLFFSQPDGIYQCEFDGTGKREVVAADTTNGYVYGMKLNGNQIDYQIAKAPMEEERENLSFRLDSLMNINEAEVMLSSDSFIYNGLEQYPIVEVSYAGDLLMQNQDYVLEYNYPQRGT